MAKANLFLRTIGRLRSSGCAPGADDRELLQRFVDCREETAFAALVDRYRGLVMGVCRRVLHDLHGAEDAFQATFVVLARKAGSIRGERSLGGWLHRVAFHIALRAKANARRRQDHESQVENMRTSSTPSETDRRELRDVLDEELDRLPAKYRQPLVLHYLEGKTKDETARVLGWTEGTVSGRLGRARDLLRCRLERRGLALSAGTLALVLTREAAQAAASASLVEATVRGALLAAAGKAATAGACSARVLVLADGVLRSMALAARLKWSAYALLGAVLLAAGIAGAYGSLSRTASPADRLLRTLQEPESTISCAVVSPDSQVIAVAKMSGSVSIWDGAGKRKRLTIPAAAGGGHPVCLAFAPDGASLAVGYDDRQVRLWDTSTGKARGVLAGHTNVVMQLAFSPDGKGLASAAGLDRPGQEGEVILWDLAQTRKRLAVRGDGAMRQLAFSSDGTVLLADHMNHRTGLKAYDVVSGKGRPIKLPDQFRNKWFLTDGQGVRKGEVVLPASGSVMAVSPDGTHLVLARGEDRQLVLWDLAARNGRPILQVPTRGHPGGVGVALAAGARKIAFIEPVGRERVVRILDGATAKEERVIRCPATVGGPNFSFLFSPDARLLICWERNGKTVQVWDVAK